MKPPPDQRDIVDEAPPTRGRIIYLHPHLTAASGAGEFCVWTADGLVRHGWRVHMICIAADFEWKLRMPSVSVHEIGGALTSSPRHFLSIRRVVEQLTDLVDQIVSDEDAIPAERTVLFPQVFPANWWAAGLLRRRSMRCVWFCQEPSAFIHCQAWIAALPQPQRSVARLLRPVLRRVDVRLCRRFGRVLCNSEATARHAAMIYGYAESNVKVIHLGVAPPDSSIAIDPHAGRHGLVSVAKLTGFKNVHLVLEAYDLVRRRGSDPGPLHIIGDGDRRSSLQRLARRLGIAAEVHFHGRLPRGAKDQIVAGCRASILASDGEPFGLVVVESLALGTPVIAVDRGGPPEIIADTAAGILIQRPNARLIATAIERILQPGPLNPSAVSRCEAALSRSRGFTWSQTVERLDKEFGQMISVIDQKN